MFYFIKCIKSFSGHATAERMLQHFEKGVIGSRLDVKDMEQVSIYRWVKCELGIFYTVEKKNLKMIMIPQ